MKRLSGIASVLVLAAIAAWALWPGTVLPAGARADLVVVDKSERRLELYSGKVLLKSYSISLGRHPTGPKRQQGDGKTPEGEYRIDYRKPDSSFHKALHISYPSPTDSAEARRRGADPGGMVMVHGMRNGLGWLGRTHLALDWTNGCVAVTDREIDEIWRAVPDGTRIVLRP
jgi:murein L,D-transpeptidase YafK